MYEVITMIQGTAPILQHAFPATVLGGLMQGAKRKSGETDYTLEYLDTMYATPDCWLYQPASHIEGALVRAAATFKIKGARGKSWKDAVRAYVSVVPEVVYHLRDGEQVIAPGPELIEEPTPYLSVDVRRVVVQRSAVARSRLCIASGWQLAFTLLVIDDQVTPEALRAIIEEAGRAVGIGDFRPKFGRFAVMLFEPKL